MRPATPPARLGVAALCAALVGSCLGARLLIPVPLAAQGAPQAPQALLDAAWNAADWPAALAILDTMGESEAAMGLKLRARLNHGWELLAAGQCEAAHAQFERALGLSPGHAEALRGLAMTRGRCPQVMAAPAPRASTVAAPTAAAPSSGAPGEASPTSRAAAMTPQPVRAPTRYVVQRGDTLYSLARRYGLTVAELQRANGLNDDALQAGQTLIIPPPGAGSAQPGPQPGTGAQMHTVRRGDTLFSVARRYGSTVLAIQAANGLPDDRIRLGQSLVIPPGNVGGARTHRVVQGDTLFSLARRYSATVAAIQAANGLGGTEIVVGTLLVIP